MLLLTNICRCNNWLKKINFYHQNNNNTLFFTFFNKNKDMAIVNIQINIIIA